MPVSPPLDLSDLCARLADSPQSGEPASSLVGPSRLSGVDERSEEHSRWGPVDWVATTGSTNADVAAAARAGAAPGRVLIAEHQGTGRGRLGRQWESPAGASLAMSVLVAPSVPLKKWTWLPLLTGLAVADGLREVAVDDVALKWPNDVLVGGGKICGILTELVESPSGQRRDEHARLSGVDDRSEEQPAEFNAQSRPNKRVRGLSSQSRPAAVIGIGVNVSLAVDELPVPTATSLLLSGVDVPKAEVAAAILWALDRWLARFEVGTGLAAAYERECSTIGRSVRVEPTAGDPVTGTAIGVDATGRLGVRTSADIQWFSAGDVFHLR